MKKNINKVMLLNILSIILLQGLSMISSPIFSRLLGTDGYGSLSSFTVWSGIVCTIFSLQTATTIVNARVEYPEDEQNAYQSSVMFLSLLSFSAVSILSFLFVRPIMRFLQVSEFVVFLILLQAVGSFLVGFLSSKFTYEFAAGRNLLLSVGMAVATFSLELILVLNMPQEERFLGRVLGNAAVYGAVGLAGAVWILRRGRRLVDRKYWNFCLMLSVPLIFQNLSYQLLGNSDIVMLKQMTGSSESGIYSLALTLSGIMFTIFTALNNSWVPFYFDDMKEQCYDRASERAFHFMELFTVLSMGFVLLVREVFRVYAPEEFWSGTQLMPVFVGSYFINFLNTFPVNFETFHKKTNVVAGATIAAAVLNLGLNFVGILIMGPMGAAIATVLSHVLQFSMHECYTRFVLKACTNPLPAFCWVKYSLAYLVAAAAFYLLADLWYIRWLFGAMLGLWELWRIWKRKALI